MSIRCKFYCSEVAKVAHYGGGNVDQERVKLIAVTADTPENKAWSKWTPSGSFEVLITNPEAIGKIEVGKSYFIDLTIADHAI
jgi:hypothetical protein